MTSDLLLLSFLRLILPTTCSSEVQVNVLSGCEEKPFYQQGPESLLFLL